MVLDTIVEVSRSFWSSDVWLPPNVTWSDMQPTDENNYPDFRDIWYPILYSFALTFVRLVFERYVAFPVPRSPLLSIRHTLKRWFIAGTYSCRWGFQTV